MSVLTLSPVLIEEVLKKSNMEELTNERALSITKRGLTQVVWDKSSRSRVVARMLVTEEEVDPLELMSSKVLAQCKAGTRSSIFTEYAYEHRDNMKNIVPMLRAPVRTTKYGFEVYEEVTMLSQANRRMNLHKFLTTTRIRKQYPENHMLGYLFDAAVGMRSLHEHGWAHMDLSLSNIAITDDTGYIIDFESTLPATENLGYMKRKYLKRVPIKATFVPPEHFIAQGEEWICLQNYDTWAFGVMIFSALFGEYLLPYEMTMDKKGRKRAVLKDREFNYFVRNGFEKFLLHCKPHIHEKLFGKENPLFILLCDLLTNIFCNPRPLKSKNPKKGIVWSSRNRFTAPQICHHPFWNFALKSKRDS